MPHRQPQAQAVPRTRSQVPNVYRFFARPDGADQPLAVPPVLSRQNQNEQQAAINAAIKRQLDSSQVHSPLGAHEQDSSAARSPTSIAASDVPLRTPPSNGSVAADDRDSQLVDPCVVCMDANKDWLCMPCGHLAMCGACTARVSHQTGHCPICKQYIQQIVQGSTGHRLKVD